MKEILLEIYTPAKSVYTGKVKSVTVPGTLGSFQILYNHAPIISTLEKGKVKIEEISGKIIFFNISGGMVEIIKNKILLLAESLEETEN